MKQPQVKTLGSGSSDLSKTGANQAGISSGWLQSYSRARGFTVLELVVTVSVLIVLAAIAVPTLTPAYESYRLSRQATAVSSLLKEARFLAVKNNKKVDINVVSSGALAACPNSCVYVDVNQNATWDASEPLVAMSSDISILPAGTAPSLTSSFYANAVAPVWPITFNSRGVLTSGTVYVVYLGNPNLPEWGYRAITITAMGQVKTWAAASNGGWHTL